MNFWLLDFGLYVNVLMVLLLVFLMTDGHRECVLYVNVLMVLLLVFLMTDSHREMFSLHDLNTPIIVSNGVQVRGGYKGGAAPSSQDNIQILMDTWVDSWL